MRILAAAVVTVALILQSTSAVIATEMTEFDFYHDAKWGLSTDDERIFAAMIFVMMKQQACQMNSNVILGQGTAGEAALEAAETAWAVFGKRLSPERQVVIYNQIWATLWPVLRGYSPPEISRLCIIWRAEEEGEE